MPDPTILPAETLLILAAAAEYMAAESDTADRDGRDAAYLYRAARAARAAADAPRAAAPFHTAGPEIDGRNA